MIKPRNKSGEIACGRLTQIRGHSCGLPAGIAGQHAVFGEEEGGRGEGLEHELRKSGQGREWLIVKSVECV